MLSKNFIQRGKEFTTFEKFVPAPYFRKTFSLSETPKNAVINVCGLGFYRLFINGEEITKGFLAPYISNPDEIFFYDSYEVADKLTEGKNVLAVVLGNGYLNNPGGDIWEFDKAPFRDAPKLAMSFEADGKVLFEADESFKCAPSPIVFDDYRCGEHYDATKEIPDWNKTDFDDGKWQNAIKAKTPLGKPALCNSEPIVKVAEYSPTEFYKSYDKWVYVFPYNRAGVCKLRIKGKRGQKVVLTYGEVIKEGKVDIKNIIFDKTSDLMHKDAYTLKGEGVEEYTPSFTYHGFQFVSVEGMTDEQAVKDTLTFVAFNSDIKSAGTFSCSDETLNKLQELVRRADLANFHYFPTDCPQREKN
ncbi:MAG: family 78 glycoside hydrolase catalytic domain, partial [Clostridia bacterium]|nr:family 78 glycoside hydrolase catalytic domain [Clostridia bacterium]